MRSPIVRGIISIFAVFVFQASCCGGCNPTTTPPATDTPQPTSSLTPLPTATEEVKEVHPDPILNPENDKLPTPTQTQTVTGTATLTATTTKTAEPPCLIPLSPPDGAGFDAFGKISFSWESNINAASYVVAVTAPNGTVMTFPSKSNEYSRWIESFAWGGEFSWQVLALDAGGNVLCRSVPVTFKKPVTEPSVTAVPQGKGPGKSKCLLTTCP